MLYPAIEPYATHNLAVGQDHQLYVEECGNPAGWPVVFLHGGPGSGCNENHRRYFDPQQYRIVLFDQRGCGRSTPYGELRDNHTQALCGDMEAIRRYLDIESWLLFAGSWGVTLGLSYALNYPEPVAGMILRGAFLGRERDLDWFVGEQGVQRIFPEAAESLLAHLTPQQRKDPIAAYYRGVRAPDLAEALGWARAWSRWGDRVVTWNLAVSEDASKPGAKTDDDRERVEASVRLVAKVRLETHYAYFRYFLADAPLLQRLSGLPEVPVSIVHGRRDLTCPVEAAWSLHQGIAGSTLRVIPDAGHLAGEPSMVDVLVEETDRLGPLIFD